MDNEELFNRYLSHDLDKVATIQLKKILETEQGRRDFYEFMDGSSQIITHLKKDEALSEEDLILSELVKKSEENLIESLELPQNPAPVYKKQSSIKQKQLL